MAVPMEQVDKLHAHGGSALMEASTSGNYSVVKLLIDNGAQATIKDKDGVTALMSAASQVGRAFVARGGAGTPFLERSRDSFYFERRGHFEALCCGNYRATSQSASSSSLRVPR